MPEPSTRIKDPRALKWTTINDFSAGIEAIGYGANSLAAFYGATLTLPSRPSAYLSDKSTGVGTYSCIANPAGGLTSLPAMQLGGGGFSASIQNNNVVGTLNGDPFWILGAAAVQNVIYYATAFNDHSGNIQSELRVLDGSGGNTIVNGQSVAGTYTGGGVPTFPFLTYILNGSTPEESVGWSAVSGIGCTIFQAGGTVTGIGSSVDAWYFSHQGRVVQVRTSPITGLAGYALTCYVNFTDPPETTSLGAQLEIFFTNVIDAISTWGSLSSGELLLITQNSGGVIVSGDIFSPFITTVPGIMGTGFFWGKSDISSIGMAYLNSNQGAWVWNGGPQSQKISNQLPANFYNLSGELNNGGTFADTTRFSVGHFDNWILFPDNWLFDTVNNVWWMLASPVRTTGTNAQPLINSSFHWVSTMTSGGESVLVGFPAHLFFGSGQKVATFSSSVFPTSYQWMSNPMILSDGEVIDIEEVVVTATGNVGHIIISLTTLSGSTVSTDTINLATVGQLSNPVQFRLPLKCQSDIAQLTISVTSQSTSKPVVINSVSLGHRTRWHMQAT